MENKKKILVIDDDQGFRQLMLSVLEDDFNISLAENGEEGYKLLESFIPDLVLLDIQMPKMTGIEFIEKMTLDPEIKKTPIIVITGGEDFNPLTNAMLKKEEVVKGFMSKMLSIDNIVEKVKEVMEIS